MRTVDLIQRKRDGEELAPEEIEYLVNGYTTGEIPDYQMSSFLMAVYFKEMTDREVSRLTECMLRSGDTVGIVAPASNIQRDALEAGCRTLERLGYNAENVVNRAVALRERVS